ncbi:hypothetical protein HN51_034600 [Arachis hypogaea]
MNPNLLYLLPPSPFVLLSPLSAAMDSYFHHSHRLNTYIPLPPRITTTISVRGLQIVLQIVWLKQLLLSRTFTRIGANHGVSFNI